MLIGAMSCDGGGGGGASGGGGGGGRIVSSLTKYLVFARFCGARRGFDESVLHPIKPGPKDQQKTYPRAGYNTLILLNKLASETTRRKARFCLQKLPPPAPPSWSSTLV